MKAAYPTLSTSYWLSWSRSYPLSTQTDSSLLCSSKSNTEPTECISSCWTNRTNLYAAESSL